MKRCVLHDLDESARKGLSEMSKQEWRTIEEYEGIYEISNDGRIRSIRRLVNGVPRGGKELKVSKMKSGIYCIRLKGLDGKLHFELITRLVAKAFIKNRYPDKAKFVTYIDDSLSVEEGLNSADNLAWVSFRARSIEKSKVPISAFDPKEGIQEKFANVEDAKEKLKLPAVRDICECLAHRRDEAYGYSWTFLTKGPKDVYVFSELKEV